MRAVFMASPQEHPEALRCRAGRARLGPLLLDHRHRLTGPRQQYRLAEKHGLNYPSSSSAGFRLRFLGETDGRLAE
jgi:hypothetical protein